MRFLLLSVLLLGACGGGPEPLSPGSSLLLVSLDTTRADRLGSYGRPNAGTQRLDRLADRGVRFQHAHTPVPVTLPAHTSLFTGQVPPQHGVRDNVAFEARAELVTLAEILTAEGYLTGAFVGGQPLHRQYGLSQGFQHYDDELTETFPIQERKARDVVAAAVSWLEGLGPEERFFAFVHLFDAHAPYTPPMPQQALFAGDPYQAEIAAMDVALGKLFRSLEESGQAARTLVVVTADHGESLGEHHESTHAFLVYQCTMRVPLLLAGPGIPEGVVVDAPVSLVDVLPTLLDLLGLPPLAHVAGATLVPLWSDAADARPVYLESRFPEYSRGWSPLHGVISSEWKYIEAGGESELYDLRADPEELRDLAVTHPERTRDLAAELARLRAGWPDAESRVEEELSEEELDAFRALGYVGEEPAEASRSGRHPRRMIRLVAVTQTARQLIGAGQVEEALQLLASLEASYGPDPGVYQVRALAHTAPEAPGSPESNQALAIESYEAALAINPQHVANWGKLTELLLESGDTEKALVTAKRALSLAPEDPYTRALLERARAARGGEDG